MVLPAPEEDWRADIIATATALWQVLRAHPKAIPLILTRRSVSASSYAPAERIIAALSRAGLDEFQVLAGFRGVLALATGLAQAEFADMFAGTARHDQANIAGAAQVGQLAGSQYPHIASLARVSQRSSAAEDFRRALDMFLTGIAAGYQPEARSDV